MDPAASCRISAGVPTEADLASADLIPGDRDERRAVLDALASGASTGSPSCLDALLAAIDRDHLDRPAIRRIIVNDHDADDVHQDVLISVARSITRFRSEASFTTWLHTVARNAAIAHLRRIKDTQQLGPDDQAMTVAPRLSSMIADRQTLQAAVAELPDHYRIPVILRDIEQHSYDEIAASMDIGVNTVKSRLSRGRAMVAQNLRDDVLADPSPDGGVAGG